MSAVWDGHIAAPFEMRGRQRTIAACDADAARSLAPWSLDAEDKAVAAWNAVKTITPEIARQERRAVEEMIEHLLALRGIKHGRGEG